MNCPGCGSAKMKTLPVVYGSGTTTRRYTSFSSNVLATAPVGAVVEHLSGEPTEIASQLEARGIRHIYVDGGITIQRFLRAGVIQHLIITRVPVLIGEGIPLFSTLPHDVRLHHVSTRSFPSGLVQS